MTRLFTTDHSFKITLTKAPSLRQSKLYLFNIIAHRIINQFKCLSKYLRHPKLMEK
jgi:hypothetical protein